MIGIPRIAWLATLLFAPGVAHAAEVLDLPLSGLRVAIAGAGELQLHGAWALQPDGVSFEALDVIDERARGRVVATTAVSVGWLANGCAEVVARMPLDHGWVEREVHAWGARWHVRGGVRRDGRRALLACTTRSGRKALLLTRLEPDHGAEPALAGLRRFTRLVLARAVFEAYAADRLGTALPTTHPDVWNRGALRADRTLHLPWSDLEVPLPHDGAVWVAGEVDGVDVLERVAPALPELAIVVVRVESDCGATRARRAAAVLTCRDFAWGALLMGAATPATLVDALVRAAAHARAPIGSALPASLDARAVAILPARPTLDDIL